MIQVLFFGRRRLILYLEPSNHKQSWDVELGEGLHNTLHVFVWKSANIG